MCLNVTCMLQSALEARAELLGVYSVYSRLIGLFASNFLWVLRIELRSLCLHDKWFYPISHLTGSGSSSLKNCLFIFVGCVCTGACDPLCVNRSEDNLQEFVLSLHHMDGQTCQQAPLSAELWQPCLLCLQCIIHSQLYVSSSFMLIKFLGNQLKKRKEDWVFRRWRPKNWKIEVSLGYIVRPGPLFPQQKRKGKEGVRRDKRGRLTVLRFQSIGCCCYFEP